MHLRDAANQLLAIGWARGGQLPFQLFDAIAMSEEEADKLQTDVNVQRLIDETLRGNS